jgi:hypothetical protein
MNRFVLILLALAARYVMAADTRPALATAEYRVPHAFIEWLQHEGKPPPVYPAGMIICERMSLGTSDYRWPPNAFAIYIAASSRLIVKHTPPFLKALDQLAAQWRRTGQKIPPNAKLLQALRYATDPRTWDQVVVDFMAWPDAAHSDYEGRRLKELDRARAFSFLIPFLAKDQPISLRVKAIYALGWNAFHEAIPALTAIAQDETEDEYVRGEALNPGLRYMNRQEALSVARSLANHKSEHIHKNASWVISSYGTDPQPKEVRKP